MITYNKIQEDFWLENLRRYQLSNKDNFSSRYVKCLKKPQHIISFYTSIIHTWLSENIVTLLYSIIIYLNNIT